MLWSVETVQFLLLEHHRKPSLVVTAGIFDELTAEAVRFLRDARLKGDALIVFLSPDGSTRDIADRAAVLSAVRYVDFVVPCNALESELRVLQPDVVLDGPDGPLSSFAR